MFQQQQVVTVGHDGQQNLSPTRSARVVEIPARQIEIPSRTVEVPARQIQITGEDGQPVTIDIPARMIEVPGRVIEVPGRAINISDAHGASMTVQETPQQVIEQPPQQENRAIEFVQEIPQQFSQPQPQYIMVQQPQPQPQPQPQHVFFQPTPVSYEQIYGDSPQRAVPQQVPTPQPILDDQFTVPMGQYQPQVQHQPQTIVVQQPMQTQRVVVGNGMSQPRDGMSSFQSIIEKGHRRDLKPVYEPAPIDYDINAVRAMTSAYNQVNYVRSIDTEGSYNYIVEQRQLKDRKKARNLGTRGTIEYPADRMWTVGTGR